MVSHLKKKVKVDNVKLANIYLCLYTKGNQRYQYHGIFKSVREYINITYYKYHETIVFNFRYLDRAGKIPSWCPLSIGTMQKFPSDGPKI